jgi:hypothetical protein
MAGAPTAMQLIIVTLFICIFKFWYAIYYYKNKGISLELNGILLLLFFFFYGQDNTLRNKKFLSENLSFL